MSACSRASVSSASGTVPLPPCRSIATRSERSSSSRLPRRRAPPGGRMKIRNPYRNLLHWFRGNTHAHSTLSDGEWALEQVVAFYRERGYAFLAMTDHDVFTDLSRHT